MKKWIVLLSCLFLASCTVTPDHVTSDTASYDDTTPPGVDPQNGGFLEWIVNPDGTTWGAIITPDGRDRYNFLIEYYAKSYKAEHNMVLVKDSGVMLITYKGVAAYKIDSAHYAAYLKMNDWLAGNRDKDSAWLNINWWAVGAVGVVVVASAMFLNSRI
jgi:hypothetical protein